MNIFSNRLSRGLLAFLTSLSLITGAGITGATIAADKAPKQESRAEIEAVVRDYLQEHPEAVIGAIQEWQRRQQLAQMLPAIQTYRGYLENDPSHPVIGNPDGDITLVEFFDYRCGYCRRHFPSVMKLVREDKNIRYIPRQFPVLDRPEDAPVSRLASRAALAAHKQGKFEAFHTAVMTGDAGLTEEKILKIAENIGLDIPRLKQDMNDKLIEKNIENNLSIGRDIGFTGTPSYIIGDAVVLGAEGYDSLKNAIDKARAAKKQTSSADSDTHNGR